jgi:RimJ/RimL family protein N-acetyltransferase
MIQITAYEPWHFKKINLIEHEKQKILTMSKICDLDVLAEQYYHSSTAFTGWLNHDIIGIAGVLEVWPGVGEAWMHTSKEFPGLPMVARIIKKMLNSEFKHLHRIQCTVIDGFTEAERLAEWLGFKKEGLMEAYGFDKTNHTRFAKINL